MKHAFLSTLVTLALTVPALGQAPPASEREARIERRDGLRGERLRQRRRLRLRSGAQYRERLERRMVRRLERRAGGWSGRELRARVRDRLRELDRGR